jgi:glycosyltransferase involved in cell wall biosynthesis
MPEVSVVIPAFNAQRTLSATLRSVLAQTLQDLEIIVVNDGSSDATEAVANDVSDPRIRVVSVVNGGVARARNRGVAEAQAELVAFLDADDLFHPSKLELQVGCLAGNMDSDICVTAATRVDAQANPLGPMPLLDAEDDCQALLLRSMVVGCISSAVIRKSALESVGGFNPDFSQCADWDLWLRLSLVTRFTKIHQELVSYRTHGTNMSGDIGLLESDTFGVLDAFFGMPGSAPYERLRRHAYSRHWMICAGSYLHTRQPGPASRCVVRGLLADPTNIGRPLGMPLRWGRRLARWRRKQA